MSRETDTSSSGPQGRGGAAYPSGTPPYGSPQYQDASGAGAPAQPEEKKTETTLTTRIRINIPGSRPIPPVVVRKPVNGGGQDAPADEPEQESPAERTAQTPRPDADDPAPGAAVREKPTSDWFAPRKAPAAAPADATAEGPAAPDAGPAAGPGPAAAPGAGTDGSPVTGAATGPAPGAGGNGAGYAATSAAPGDGAPGGPQTRPRDGAGAPGMPYFSDAPGGPGASGPPATSGISALADLTGPTGPGGSPGPSGPTGPTGPTSGPAFGTAALRATGGAAATAPRTGPAPAPGGGMSDDTAILTPQKPHPAPEPHPGPPPGQVSGDTLTSGIPVVSQDDLDAPAPSPFPMSGPARAAGRPDGYDDTFDAYPPALDEPAPEAPAPTPPPATRAAPAPAKKGRSKLVLLAVGVVVAASVAYGAGLLLNQADVPKGTTVLGVDIGGSTKEEAVQKLDAALGPRAARPLQLEVGGRSRTLAPDKAGLSLDSQATVRAAAGSDYNPVTVIGSLFGAERVAQPVIPVDEEKLGVALSGLGGGSGAVTEGTVKFEPGKAVPVPGKAGTVIDVRRSMLFVRDAYRAQVETGRPNVVELPVATREPMIQQAEIDRAMREFAEPAMSGLITIKAGGKQIQFGPQRSLPQILSMKAVGNRLEPYYDKEAINRLLDGTFDGVMITKGDGKKHQLSADDVAAAMHKALVGKTEAERTVTIELDPQG
ncbi:hypothetical protein [Streptomyces sp. NPDC095602]|uniref:hypothetical protein n=1 Tax=Streptomyces sp. NPDC095602 TaxID=3155819 RepID=UPI00332BF2E5